MAADMGIEGILVTGDSTIDWFITEPAVSVGDIAEMRYVWTLGDGPGIGGVHGGAAFDADLLSAIGAEASEAPRVVGPEIVEDIAKNPSSPRITRTFSTWALQPDTVGNKRLVWRMSRFLGIHRAQVVDPTLFPSRASMAPACILIEDGNQQFRNTPNLWPTEAIGCGGQVLVRQTGAVGTGPLWEYLNEYAADRITLFCTVGDLRKDGAPIGQPLSWERTAQDVVSAVRSIPSLGQVRRVVVGLSASGAVIVDRNGEDLLIYDPRAQEGDWERNRPGLQFGAGTMVLVAIAWAYGRAGLDADVRRAVIDGIETSRLLHHDGFAAERDESGTKVTFPIASLAASLVRGAGSETDIQCVAVSLDPAWRIFDNSSAGSFRGAAEQIARYGVNRVGKEIPLESMGAWTSVDRVEIESMRSVRNIISEYLSSSTRTRPLNLAVFGPPGSGKSFAIKQMASVISHPHLRLGSLEFNLSQFHSVSELPEAFQHVRDLRLREYLPLVFWDEFDSALDGNELGWLVSFLAPMQDGTFSQDGVTRPIGPAIFIFAGGTHATMDSFKRRAMDLPGAKATDFLSRLRGYVDVLGPNPDSASDRTYHLRRGMLLRAILQRAAPQIFDGEQMRIDPAVLAAFLDVPAYLHGSRSMEAIVEMSAISRKLAYERSALPGRDQLELHVDAAAFMRIVENGTSGRT